MLSLLFMAILPMKQALNASYLSTFSPQVNACKKSRFPNENGLTVIPAIDDRIG